MKLYAPKYYKNFKCIADKCEHSCCVGWEIDVDKDTLEKYKKLESGYGAAIRGSISTEDTPHFKLSADDRCPHLDERGLCKIILSVGEDYLCDICREHPRFYNYTSVAEVGIGMSCMEAARIILSSPDYPLIEEIGNIDAERSAAKYMRYCRIRRATTQQNLRKFTASTQYPWARTKSGSKFLTPLNILMPTTKNYL